MAVYHLKAGFRVPRRWAVGGAPSATTSSARAATNADSETNCEHRESTGICRRGPQEDPRAYWQAADEHERANGRLYSEIQFALPRDLDAGGRRELAGAFAARVCAGERLPYTLAIHKRRARRPPTSRRTPTRT